MHDIHAVHLSHLTLVHHLLVRDRFSRQQLQLDAPAVRHNLERSDKRVILAVGQDARYTLLHEVIDLISFEKLHHGQTIRSDNNRNRLEVHVVVAINE